MTERVLAGALAVVYLIGGVAVGLWLGTGGDVRVLTGTAGSLALVWLTTRRVLARIA